MIECLVCKKYQHESYFVELKYGGLAICVYCSDTEEAKKLKEETKKKLEKVYEQQMAYLEEEERRYKENIFDDY